MIAHSLVVLTAFLSCIIGPIVLAVTTTQENKYKPDPRTSYHKDAHFLKG
jgi:hypothetical protein